MKFDPCLCWFVLNNILSCRSLLLYCPRNLHSIEYISPKIISVNEAKFISNFFCVWDFESKAFMPYTLYDIRPFAPRTLPSCAVLLPSLCALTTKALNAFQVPYCIPLFISFTYRGHFSLYTAYSIYMYYVHKEKQLLFKVKPSIMLMVKRSYCDGALKYSFRNITKVK